MSGKIIKFHFHYAEIWCTASNLPPLKYIKYSVMALTKSASELGSIPTPDASFLNITDTICDKNITKK